MRREAIGRMFTRLAQRVVLHHPLFGVVDLGFLPTFDGVMITTAYDAPDRSDGEPTRITAERAMDLPAWMTTEDLDSERFDEEIVKQIYETSRALLASVCLHEVDEMIRLDGVHLDDPHPPKLIALDGHVHRDANPGWRPSGH